MPACVWEAATDVGQTQEAWREMSRLREPTLPEEEPTSPPCQEVRTACHICIDRANFEKLPVAFTCTSNVCIYSISLTFRGCHAVHTS